MRPPHHASPKPDSPLSLALVDIVERFLGAWQQAPGPDLDAFLPAGGELRRRALAELAPIDLEHRLRAGRPARAEDYLARYPEAADDGALLSGLIEAEYRVRRQCEPGLDAAEYRARFPQCRVGLLAFLPAAAGAAATLHTSPPDAPAPTRPSPPPGPAAPAPPAAGRYQLGEEVGRGGMGAVLRARDPQLNRDLAVKVLRGDGHERPELRRRFVEEAQVCSQLQHPGIVPVHDLGTLPDGRPFFAMKLVKGRTLAELLKERLTPSDNLPRFLDIFEQVCQAVGYAHSKGVIHRDLKPLNVMVGAFGEVQVMDWGLAKVLRPPGGEAAAAEAAASVVRTVRSDSGDQSRDGQAMGTPAYMAPEQARGEVDLLDERCDVFGLGAILCEILTAAPPFRGDARAAHAHAACERLGDAFARLDGCGADAELVALAKQCLAARPEGRPRDGGAVAQAVTAYRQAVRERLRQAELGRARALVQAAEERKRRRLTAALAAAVLAVLALGAGVGLWAQRQRAEWRRDVETALARVVELQGQSLWAEARGVLEQAERRLAGGGPGDLRAKLARVRDELRLVARLDEIRLRGAALVDGRLDLAGTDRLYEEAFREAGMGPVGGDAAAAADWVAGSGVRPAVVTGLNCWFHWSPRPERQAWLREVLGRADPDPWREAARRPGVFRDREAAARLAEGAQAGEQPGELLAIVGATLSDLRLSSEGLLRAAQERRPGDFWVNVCLANALRQAGKHAEAIVYHRAALALRPGTAVVHANLAGILCDLGQPEEALTECRRALDREPALWLAHHHRSRAFSAQGRPDEAIAAARRGVEGNPKLADAHLSLALAFRAGGRPDEAVAEFRRAVEVEPNYAWAHMCLGRALDERGRAEEAFAALRRGLELSPLDGWLHFNFGQVLRKHGRLDEAAAEFRKALDLGWQNGQAYAELGGTLADRGRTDEAVTQLHRALERDPKCGPAYLALGEALKKQGRIDEATAEYRKALRLGLRDASLHNNLGNILQEQGRPDEAVAQFREALRLGPPTAVIHSNLGNALRSQGRTGEAVAEYRKAIALNPTFAPAHGALGETLFGRGQFTEAREETRRCLELLPPNHPLRRVTAEQLARCERLLALEKQLPAVLKGESRPADVGEQLVLAALCVHTRRYAAALRFYADAFAARPQVADDLPASHRYNAACAAALAAAGGAPPVPDGKERARLRRQGLDWLRADLALWGRLLEGGPPQARAAAPKALRHWQQDADLASVRDPQALAALPADERGEWEKLWAEVAYRLWRLDAAKGEAAAPGK